MVARGGTGLIDIADIEHGLGGQEEESFGGLLLVLAFKLHAARTLALEQRLAVGSEDGILRLGVLVATHLGNLLHALHAVLHRFKVLELQLRINDLLVAHGVDRTVDMDHIAVVKAAQHVNDGIRFADVAQELVAEALALRCSLYQTCNVDNLDRGGHDASGMDQLGQLGETLVGHGDDTHVGLNGAEWEIGRLCLGITQAVEQGGLAHIGQTHNAAL